MGPLVNNFCCLFLRLGGMEHVVQVHRKYRDDNYDFGLDHASFHQLLTEAVPQIDRLVNELWEIFDPNGVGL